MNCTNHPEVLAESVCAGCSRPFCRDCVVEIGGAALCASCKEEKVREMKSGTGGIDLATRWSRLGASMLDGLILGVAFILLVGTATFVSLSSGAFKSNGDRPPGGAFIAVFLGAYGLFFIASFVYEWQMVASSGQTLGKKALGIKIVSEDGQPLGSRAWQRPLFRYLCAVVPFLGVIDILMVFTERNQTLHDRGAKTLVVNWKR